MRREFKTSDSRKRRTKPNVTENGISDNVSLRFINRWMPKVIINQTWKHNGYKIQNDVVNEASLSLKFVFALRWNVNNISWSVASNTPFRVA